MHYANLDDGVTKTDLLFVVSGTELYKVEKTKTATLLGSIATSGGTIDIDIASNVTNVVVVNTPDAYTYDLTTFAQITDLDFTSRGAGDVEFLDNYLLFREPDSGRFFGADAGSATAFNALNFATAEGSPDDLNGLKVDHQQLLAFGHTNTEIWEDVGGSGFPFRRSINGYIEQGCASGKTIASIDNSLQWVANDRTVRRLDGITPIRVSTHYIEEKLASAVFVTAYSYTQNGHLFYVLVTTSGTYVYDATTMLWHERQTYNSATWNQSYYANAFGLHLVGNSTSNVIGELSTTTYADVGSTQRMEWTYQPVYAEGQRAFHKRLEIVAEMGVGLTTGQGSAPEVMLDLSDDGGKTWTSMPNKSLGAIGAYKNRAVWTGLGSSHQRVYRAAISDPVIGRVTDTLLEVDGGRL